MSVTTTVLLDVMDLSGVFCVADSVLLIQVFFKIPFYGILWGCTHVLCGFPTVMMNSEGCVDKPTNDVKSVSGMDEFIVNGFEKKENQPKELAPIVLVGGLDLSAKCSNCELDVRAGPFAKEESLCNESVKGFSFFRRQLRRSAGVMEVRGSWRISGILGTQLDRKIIQHGLNAVFHVDADLAFVAEVKVHC